MSSSRHRRHYLASTHPEDSPEISDGASEHLAYQNSRSRTSNGHKAQEKRVELSASYSSTSSPSNQSENMSSDNEAEMPDPVVNHLLIQYMVETRKRHIKIQKDYNEKAMKAMKTRHNVFFSDHPDFGKPSLEVPSYNRKPGPAHLSEEYLRKESYSDSRVPLHAMPQSETPTRNSGHAYPQSREQGDQEYVSPAPVKPFNSISVYASRSPLEPKPAAYSTPDILEHPVGNKQSTTTTVWADCVQAIPLAYKIVLQSGRSRQGLAVKLATLCQREVEKTAYRRNRLTREIVSRSKRHMRDMLAYWRHNEKEEREARKRAEKEELEKRKQEEEAREARRHEKKLNFLITQTELYGHFVSKRMNQANADPEDDVAPVNFNDMDFDADDAALQEQARRSAQHALKLQTDRTRQFDQDAHQRKLEGEAESGAEPPDVDQMNFQDPSTMQKDSNIEQPKMLTCQLKSYQLKGLNWLANLYEQGINGILADEMGLGKTVQSISLLAHLAESHNIWGPFLVIAPASTLHNWQQELTKFSPALKTLPYWGNVKDRKTLRKFWSQKQLYTRDAPFHVLVTSYQLIMTDERYFQRIKWQYMILDEAQAIKSSASARWKTLMNFHCRNRLLLTGTPIQNSMQELWALLHFIMPSLFDSHEEFSEWFSRDIENHAENSGQLDQHQLSRLHMILKPFMLRRVKKNVQHELGEKIELEIMCSLTPRQRQLYSTLRERISLSELLAKSQSSLDNTSVESLLNLVIQFRKVCNHPELFERADVQSPLAFCRYPEAPPGDFPILPFNSHSHIQLRFPRIVYTEAVPQSPLLALKSDFNIWTPDRLVTRPENLLTNCSPGDLAGMRRLDLPTLVRLHHQESQIASLNVFNMTPQTLLQGLQERYTFSGVPEATLDQMIGLRATSCYQPKAVAPPPAIDFGDIHHQEFQKRLAQNRSLRSDLLNVYPDIGFSDILVPAPAKLIMNSGKLMALDKLLTQLKVEGHRVLLYSQMTRMIDLMEEYLTYRQHSYLRLDGSSKISDRRDLVEDWQTRPDLFVFLLSTRAGGLGINLTAADTVIFYDSDWNPTVDQQAMDRAHRLGQTRQVTVYRLVSRGTIEERILQRAKQKDAIHRVVIAGGDFKAPDLKPKEIYSLLLDEDQPQTTPGSPLIQELPAPASQSNAPPATRRPPTSIADLLGPSDQDSTQSTTKRALDEDTEAASNKRQMTDHHPQLE
ncbi:putative DNA helicase ino80, variant 2 [Entomophthora muscae]|uniref:DNA helicase ino80, variant 2 n=2 Tax=Entomophthora muscae TaxID=34485 RepID=A0ACC2RYK9_9FUNG|nr:putative DNA helicase ino80, variant 2 [Entomophthora muscae]